MTLERYVLPSATHFERSFIQKSLCLYSYSRWPQRPRVMLLLLLIHDTRSEFPSSGAGWVQFHFSLG